MSNGGVTSANGMATGGSVFSPRPGRDSNYNRYHLTSSGSRTPRVFPPDMNAIPLSPSKLDTPMFRDRVNTLMQQGDTYAKRLDFERRRSHDLDVMLVQMREMHFAARKKLCQTTNAQKDAATSDVKSIRTLENRLEKVLTRYNEVCNANKKLRDDIQSLRREKVQQQQVHEKLERETHQKQSEIAKIASATQCAYDARDRANRQIEALRSQVMGEDDEFESGWMEKRTQLEQDRANIRDIPRLRTPKSPSRHMMLGSSAGTPGGFKLLSTPDIKLRDETLKNVRLITEKESDLRKQSERLKTVEDGLAKIKKKTGVADPDELAQALLTAEEKNFSLFNMINELNTEMELIEIENNALEELIEECRGSGVNSDSYRQHLRQHLEDQIEKSKQKVQYYEMRHAESAEAVDTMKNGGMSIFHKVGHNDEAFAQQLLSHGITEVNMTKLLGIIEQRIGELVDIHNIATNAPASPLKPDSSDGHSKPSRGGAADKKNAAATHGAGSHHHAVSGASVVAALLRPVPPAADDFGDSDNDEQDELVRPCKISDIQEKTASSVGRRKEKPNRSKR
ncbi:TPA: hypothetical protein N0F65_004369 [Lagenidium giganteum]|uniref:ODAD1 central coiled coil region domain-containing protein n=1 Tax=Lagenidium giganteum TaxID=4803 RepID=A0AAV2ZDC2_9STRA|nr:TPA: hypothetical protein N0F65_004369 [Lagenidium giganteum]